MNKPFSQACENNKGPILEVLSRVFPETGRVVEIGSGTGQHAVHFAAGLPHLSWQPTDRPENLPGCRLWVDGAGLPNLQSPLALDVLEQPWPVEPPVDAVFSANTAHIMHWPAVQALFDGVGRLLALGGVFALYGPFRYGGKDTSESNTRFDLFLREQDPAMGLRDMDEVLPLARRAGLALEDDVAMPANNRTLIFRRK